MAWWLLFNLGKVWLLTLAIKASTVEPCGICGEKLFHVKIVLGKNVFKYNDIGLIWLEAQG